MRLLRARALPTDAEPWPRPRRASPREIPALPENANREPPRPPQEMAHLIRDPVRKSGALTTRIYTRGSARAAGHGRSGHRRPAPGAGFGRRAAGDHARPRLHDHRRSRWAERASRAAQRRNPADRPPERAVLDLPVGLTRRLFVLGKRAVRQRHAEVPAPRRLSSCGKCFALSRAALNVRLDGLEKPRSPRRQGVREFIKGEFSRQRRFRTTRSTNSSPSPEVHSNKDVGSGTTGTTSKKRFRTPKTSAPQSAGAPSPH